MKILSYIILGMLIAYLFLFFGEFGLVLLGGGCFGLLLYIAVTISNRRS